jgi:tRNA(Arg) A34 adenosine deaminase TadA
LLGNERTRPTPPGLEPHWDRPLGEFVTLQPSPINDGLRERHRLYSLLVLAILASQWNGNKYGNPGNYGDWRWRQLMKGLPANLGVYKGGSYLGHNIAAIAVDARGTIVDFEFNHNQIFNSSVEHAESRLLRRLFSLSQVSESWQVVKSGSHVAGEGVGRSTEKPFAFAVSAPPAHEPRVGVSASRVSYTELLTDVTIYTSLESCAQCSGIMALADVREVVYLQPDQGQYLIGNMMYKATTTMGYGARAPEPIPAGAFDLPHYGRLVAAHQEFARRVPKEPFFRRGKTVKRDAAVTSFLCTDLALDIAESAAAELASIAALEHPDFVRPNRDGQAVSDGLRNEQVLSGVQSFLGYVRSQGGRGTAHRA